MYSEFEESAFILETTKVSMDACIDSTELYLLYSIEHVEFSTSNKVKNH